MLEQHEVAMAEQAQQAEIRSVVDGLVRGGVARDAFLFARVGGKRV